jgi:hypothetical protein
VKKLPILLVAVLVVALLTIIPVALRSRLDASSSMRERDSTAEVHQPLSEQTPIIAETVTATVGTTSTSTMTPSSASPTPVVSPTSSLHQGKAIVFLVGQYDSVNPVYYGTPIWIDGQAFQPGEPVTLYWNYQQPGQFVVTTVTALSNGSFQYETTTPGTPNLGTVKVAAIGMVSHLLAVTSTTEPADVIPNPINAMIGSTVQVIGGGFDGNERIDLLLQGNAFTTVTANSLGSFSATFTISNTASPGKASLQAIGQTSGLHISAAFFSISLPIAISPTSGPAGTKVTITGSHFTPSGQIYIDWFGYSGPGSNYTLTKVTATSSGTFSVVVTAPMCLSEGDGTICAFDAYDFQTQDDALIQFPEL